MRNRNNATLRAWLIVGAAVWVCIGLDGATASELGDALQAFDNRQYSQAHDLLRPLAQRGDGVAQLMLVGIYYAGWGVPPDYHLARDWKRQSARDASEADATPVVARWRRLAEAGDPLGQMMLGSAYNNGLGVDLDEAEALRWIKRSAEQGNPRGEYALAMLYQAGDGTQPDMTMALEWYRRSAAQGDNWAEYNLGAAYQFGRGVKRSNATAADWYRKAAEHGNPSAAYDLAWLLQTGSGIQRNEAEAARWYAAGATGGDPLAMNNLALMYLKGQGGLPKDPARAYQLATLACEKSHLVDDAGYQESLYAMKSKAARALGEPERRNALFELGRRSRDGDGVPQDDVQAYRWMHKSLETEDDPEAIRVRTTVLEEMAKRMHPDAIERAKDPFL